MFVLPVALIELIRRHIGHHHYAGHDSSNTHEDRTDRETCASDGLTPSLNKPGANKPQQNGRKTQWNGYEIQHPCAGKREKNSGKPEGETEFRGPI
jgi:hypothetical protein